MAHIINVFCFSNDDSERTIGEPHWFFSDEQEATKHAKSRGWYGGNASVQAMRAIVVNGDVYLLAREKHINLNETPDDVLAKKAAAKAKLTKEELELLGIR